MANKIKIAQFYLTRYRFKYLSLGILLFLIWYHSGSTRQDGSLPTNSGFGSSSLYEGFIVLPRIFEKNPFFEEIILKDLSKIVDGLGNWGQPGYLEDVLEGNHGVADMRKRYAINVNVSDRIAYNRSLPDARPPDCRYREYDIDLPTASIVVIYRNEPWSVIFRMLHSIFKRTPRIYLKEIIIVDDGSYYPELNYNFHDKINYYVSMLFPDMVTVIRSAKSVGIVKGRLQGARMASGDVLVFLDAHSEVTNVWLEPMLEFIKKKPNVVVQPTVDLINWDTFEYSPFSSMHHEPSGIFTWGGMFEWLQMSALDIISRKDHTKPIKNPVMAGGIYAVNRDFFWAVGSYDEGMIGWGSENIEMSIRVWTCGGTMVIHPCSRVGHVFKAFPPREPTNSTVNPRLHHTHNLLRTAHVWWDDYKRLLYQYRPSLKSIDFGDVSKRTELRQSLKCKSFQWYLAHVMPKYIMDSDAVYSGRLRSDNGYCITFGGHYELFDSMLLLRPCDDVLTGRQYFALSKQNELRREYLCAMPQADIPIHTYKLRLTLCGDSKYSKWKYVNDDRTIVNRYNILCLEADPEDEYPLLKPCNSKKPSQKWTFIDNSTLNIV